MRVEDVQAILCDARQCEYACAIARFPDASLRRHRFIDYLLDLSASL